jgi:hypothetical protein
LVGYRYFYYLVLINAIMNVVMTVPKILINHLFEGAFISVLLSVPIGTTLLLIAVKSFRSFPAQGINQIMKPYFSNWLKQMIMGFLIAVWLWTGLITLLTFTIIIKRFINPDASEYLILSVLLILVCLGALLNSLTVLYSLEILVIVTLPLILIFLIKSLLDPNFHVDALIETITNMTHYPRYKDLASATFVFTGYTNLVIFNQYIKNDRRFPFLWMIPIGGLGVLLTSFLIPIGINGTIAVEKFIFPWMSTADSIQFKYSFIERALFIFLLIYILLSIISTIVHWHVALELIKGVLGLKQGKSTYIIIPWLVVGLIIAISLIMKMKMNEDHLFKMTSVYMLVRLPAELLLVSILFYCAWRKKRS